MMKAAGSVTYETVRDYVVSLATQRMAMEKPSAKELGAVDQCNEEEEPCGDWCRCGGDDCDVSVCWCGVVLCCCDGRL